MNKFIKSRKFRLLLACISLLLLVDMIQDSYAKYVSSAEANGNFTIAQWAFLVNEQDALNNSDFSNTIVPVFDSNPNIKEGVIAPTSTGYFDITIDSSNVGVAFDEEITLSEGNNSNVTDIIFTGYKINNGDLITFDDTDNPSITISHSINETNTINTYRFYIEWNDNSETETMDNAADTAAAVTGNANVDITLRFIQRANS